MCQALQLLYEALISVLDFSGGLFTATGQSPTIVLSNFLCMAQFNKNDFFDEPLFFHYFVSLWSVLKDSYNYIHDTILVKSLILNTYLLFGFISAFSLHRKLYECNASEQKNVSNQVCK